MPRPYPYPGLLLRYAYELQCGTRTGNEIDNEIVRPLQST